MSKSVREIEMVPVSRLLHIENWGLKRVEWLRKKIVGEGVWSVPLKVEVEHGLVMDGQHRMEVAKLLGLRVVPCLVYSYLEVEVWSLRENQIVTTDLVVERALAGDLYPYKTAKHGFPDGADLRCSYSLSELSGWEI